MQFIVHNTTDGYYLQGELSRDEGIYYVTGHTDKEAEATKFSPMSGSTNTGKIILKGLEDDTYVITEVQTDSGYKLLKENITVEITAKESGTTCEGCGAALLTASAKVNSQDVTMTANNSSINAVVPLTVTNTKGFDLPKTGGDNSKLPYIAGSLAVLAGLGVAVAALKKKRHA